MKKHALRRIPYIIALILAMSARVFYNAGKTVNPKYIILTLEV